MGWLIDRIRSWFCTHEWECLLDKYPVYYEGNRPHHYEWLYVCKKCKRKKKIKG